MTGQNNIKDAYESYQEAYVELKEDHEFLANYANFLLEEGKRNEAIEIVHEISNIIS